MKSILLIVVVETMIIVSLKAQTGNEWPAYGGDASGKRYSPLKQVNDKNVNQLKPAWTFRTGELETYTGTRALSIAAFEATPVMVDGTLYFSTPSCRVFAVDAATGKSKWSYDPHVNLNGDLSEITSRGVSVWGKRIFMATIDGRLIALDAKTGELIAGFGNNGIVDLREGFGSRWSITSPPAVVGNMIVVGSSMGDNQRIDYPRGTVRGYDAMTGTLKWSWDPIPQESTDPAWNTWNGPNAHKTGAANAWAVISADPQRDLVFVPTSCPAPDYYGGERIGQNLYGNSIVALRASTGKMVWYYQVVHHDLWDYDIAAQPVLFDIRLDKTIPAIAVGTKMGLIFVLNRETGKPLFPIEEKPMPASTIQGEEAWKTQPIPLKPEPLGLHHANASDAWGLTPEGKAEAEKRIGRYVNKGIYTPPTFEGSLMTPSNVGGINWGGMSYDAGQDLLVTCVNRLAAIIRMIPREKVGQIEQEESETLRAETGRQNGTPYVMKRDYLFKIENGEVIMQTKPPWGTLVAIDMKTGTKKWEVPLGYMLDPKKYPGAEQWGSINLGGPIVTAGNLTFVAASRDNHLRAFNTSTGKMLWEYLLPASAQATPMSYSVNGKQYIVIAAGGHGKFSTQQGDYVVAFALPQ